MMARAFDLRVNTRRPKRAYVAPPFRSKLKRMPVEKILVVDDERLVRWSLRQKCEEWGYQVTEAPAGEPGLRLAQQESPDLVLLDVRMPDMNGIQVLEQIKKSSRRSARHHDHRRSPAG